MFASDPIFSDPRLAVLYDEFDDDRSDLDVYVELITSELGATNVLDIGCGTGSLALLLSVSGCAVTGIDPAEASLDIARGKRGASDVQWFHGDANLFAASGLGPSAGTESVGFDLAVMTGNVAQVFLDDEDWNATLRSIAGQLRAEGSLVFETRDPSKEAWRRWTPESTTSRREIDGIGTVTHWTELVSAELPLVSFRHHYEFGEDGEVVTSDSTLRFRTKTEIVGSLKQAGFMVSDVRDAPDRPGLEFVFVANRS